jgi:L-lactate dehydrogenase
MLDSARLSYEVGTRLGLAARSVDAPVLGEHGDSSFAAWSLCRAAGLPLETYLQHNGVTLEVGEREAMMQRVRRAALEIIERKGATYYAVAAAMLRVVSAIIHDAGAVLPVSIRPEKADADWYGSGDVALSLPCVVGREGVRRVVRWPLADDERAALAHSAEVLQNAWKDAVPA